MQPEDLLDLSPAQLTRLLHAVASQRYGERWQTALANEFGYSRRAVNMWALGERKPPIEMILALHYLQKPVQLGEIRERAEAAKLAADALAASSAQLVEEATRLAASSSGARGRSGASES